MGEETLRHAHRLDRTPQSNLRQNSTNFGSGRTIELAYREFDLCRFSTMCDLRNQILELIAGLDFALDSGGKCNDCWQSVICHETECARHALTARGYLSALDSVVPYGQMPPRKCGLE